MSKITSIATAVPPHAHPQHSLFEFTDTVYDNNEKESRILKYLYNHSDIETRYSVVPDYNNNINEREFFPATADLEPFPGVEKRMELFQKYAPGLSAEAITKCIEGKINTDEITHLITVSCTGVSAPGLDLQVMELLQLRDDLMRTSVNFMGCYAAIHAMKIADAFCRADANANVVVVCTELCTLHFQKDKTEDNITSTLLFGDGAAAFLMQGNEKGKGIAIDSFYSKVMQGGKQEMAWQVSSKGFLMTLSSMIPNLIKQDFSALTHKALEHGHSTREEIEYWCIHPGGKKILQAISSCLELQEDELDFSYEVLKNYGNMSSPTILFVLKKILDNAEATGNNNKIFGAAFGPGLTMETFIAHYD